MGACAFDQLCNMSTVHGLLNKAITTKAACSAVVLQISSVRGNWWPCNLSSK